MKIINKQTQAVIELPYDLYPIDDLNWCGVVSKTDYTLTGSLDIQQGIKNAGKPVTLQSNDDLGLVTRNIVNQLHEQCATPETIFEMVYEKDGKIHRQDVIFDTTKAPIEAVPAKGFNSPNPDDYFQITLRFLVV